MLEALATSPNRIVTLVYLAICCVFAVTAGIIGISDNPPGVVLAFAAVAALILAVVHPWRTTRKFRHLLYASLLGLPIFAILHNVFEGVATRFAMADAIRSVLQGLGVATFLLALFVCPPAIVIGVAGLIVMSLRARRKSTQDRDGAG